LVIWQYKLKGKDMHCTNCGKEINNIDKFCAHCGSPTNNETIKADVKVEVTNATTEKAFKAVGDTILSGKQAVTSGAKTTTNIVKKFTPLVIIVAIITLIFYGFIYFAYDINPEEFANGTLHGWSYCKPPIFNNCQ
jgi:uncharacterized membrane protein YvbJ